jgi:hypothetical protein
MAAGCELFIDYALAIESEPTDEIRQLYARRWNSPGRRRSMLGASDG